MGSLRALCPSNCSPMARPITSAKRGGVALPACRHCSRSGPDITQFGGKLKKIFADLPKEVATQKRLTEVTWMFALLGALLAASAIAAAVRWSPYP